MSRFLLKAAGNQTVKLVRGIRSQGPDGRVRIVQDRKHQRFRSLSHEWPLARGHFKQDDTECVHVSPHVVGLTENLLRCHVRQRTDDHAGLRNPSSSGSRQKNGQPEVQYLRVSGGRKNDVPRLEVPMENTVLVCICNGVRDRGTKPYDVFEWQRTGIDTLLQRTTRHVLHHEVILPLARAEVVDCGDSGMTEAGERQRLPVKPLAGTVVHQRAVEQQFDRYLSIEFGVMRPPNRSHPTFPDALDKTIPAKRLIGFQRRSVLSRVRQRESRRAA